jgi:hypothetical protein
VNGKNEFPDILFRIPHFAFRIFNQPYTPPHSVFRGIQFKDNSNIALSREQDLERFDLPAARHERFVVLHTVMRLFIVMMHVNERYAIDKALRQATDERNGVEPRQLEVADVQGYGYVWRRWNHEPFPEPTNVSGVVRILYREVTAAAYLFHIFFIRARLDGRKPRSSRSALVVHDYAEVACRCKPPHDIEGLRIVRVRQGIFERMKDRPDAARFACPSDSDRLPDRLFPFGHVPVRRAPERNLGKGQGMLPHVIGSDYAITQFHKVHFGLRIANFGFEVSNQSAIRD